jgi:hypothetical protein
MSLLVGILTTNGGPVGDAIISDIFDEYFQKTIYKDKVVERFYLTGFFSYFL